MNHFDIQNFLPLIKDERKRNHLTKELEQYTTLITESHEEGYIMTDNIDYLLRTIGDILYIIHNQHDGREDTERELSIPINYLDYNNTENR